MEILTLTNEIDEYEAYLKNCQNALLYYSVSYKCFLEDLLKCEAHYLIAKEQNKICGVLPLMVKEGKFGKVANSLPFYGSNGGILSETSSAFRALYNAYRRFLQDHKIAATTLITNPLLPNWEEESQLFHFLDHRIGQWTPLAHRNEMMNAFDSSARRNIQKAKREGISVTIDNQAIDFLQDVHQKNMKAIGGLAKPEPFFSLFPSYFRANQDYKIYVASKNEKKVAALLIFYYNQTAEYFTPAILEEHRTEQPLALILFDAMVDAFQAGYRWWNWGGTWLSQDGVYQFKKKWGSVDKPYTYYTKIFCKEILEQTKESLLLEYPNFFVVPFHQLGTRSQM